MIATQEVIKNEHGYVKAAQIFYSELNNGWKIACDYCETNKSGKWDDAKEYYIDETDLKKIHNSLKDVIETYRVPVAGDIIFSNVGGMETVISVQFDTEDKRIFFWLH